MMWKKAVRWSRSLHKWIGIYVAALTVVWLAEMLFLPVAYSVPEGLFAPWNGGEVNPMTILAHLRLPPGSVLPEITYHPGSGTYSIHYLQDCVIVVVDTRNGGVVESYVDQTALFEAKSGMGWLHPVVQTVLKAPFEAAFIILSLTGIALVWPRPKSGAKLGVLGLGSGDRFVFKQTTRREDMGRLASLGLLPGVEVFVLRIGSSGPCILSARNTRIAVARDVAETFVIGEVSC